MKRPGETYDMVIIGAGISGCLMAREYSKAGLKCLLIEAGKHYTKFNYPQNEFKSNSELYWSGGIELNTKANIGFLRPKAVGGGSIVNQALLDRFDQIAFDDWRNETRIDYFNLDQMIPWYELAESSTSSQKIPLTARNRNAELFIEGMEKLGHQWSSLNRAQKNCRYDEGNDCLECIQGCPLDSKQSAAITTLPEALQNGCHLISEFEVHQFKKIDDIYLIKGKSSSGEEKTFKSKYLTLASGAIGNSKLLLNSGHGKLNSNIGQKFFTHPQYMTLAIYENEINAHKGAFQSVKSDDRSFRLNRFKLENVFAPPVAISMLIPGFGKKHLDRMKKITYMACTEVAIRDQDAGQILVNNDGSLRIKKTLRANDKETLKKGMSVLRKIFEATGAKEIIEGPMKIGLHLMGGCSIGTNSHQSVVSPHFHLHHDKNIFCADSSIFPNAPGINPSLTIMALNYKASSHIIQKEIR